MLICLLLATVVGIANGQSGDREQEENRNFSDEDATNHIRAASGLKTNAPIDDPASSGDIGSERSRIHEQEQQSLSFLDNLDSSGSSQDRSGRPDENSVLESIE